MNNSVVLDQAKEILDDTEMKMLTFLLHMRGSFSLNFGKPMLTKYT